ncbi:MAG: hypothetical protein CM15mP127_15430 [Gammaproteobacteria bacterium]|nr:MAG: hypothetical protein CM15mP127_15430 [Gammaproteobacteria bacterium]
MAGGSHYRSLGSSYAIFGGLKSVAVSDTLNGIGLLIGGLAVPILALSSLGSGSIIEGLTILGTQKPEYLKVLTQNNIEGNPVSVPWPTLLTGMMFIQYFIGSQIKLLFSEQWFPKSLAGGQKGVLFVSAMKLIGPFNAMLAWNYCSHMPDLTIDKQDRVYGAVVRHVLPDWSLGFLLQCLMGPILSSLIVRSIALQLFFSSILKGGNK